MKTKTGKQDKQDYPTRQYFLYCKHCHDKTRQVYLCADRTQHWEESFKRMQMREGRG